MSTDGWGHARTLMEFGSRGLGALVELPELPAAQHYARLDAEFDASQRLTELKDFKFSVLPEQAASLRADLANAQQLQLATVHAATVPERADARCPKLNMTRMLDALKHTAHWPAYQEGEFQGTPKPSRKLKHEHDGEASPKGDSVVAFRVHGRSRAICVQNEVWVAALNQNVTPI